jgi:hypothetical protein
MGYKSTVILKNFYPLTCSHKMNSMLVIIDLEHRMAEECMATMA